MRLMLNLLQKTLLNKKYCFENVLNIQTNSIFSVLFFYLFLVQGGDQEIMITIIIIYYNKCWLVVLRDLSIGLVVFVSHWSYLIFPHLPIKLISRNNTYHLPKNTILIPSHPLNNKQQQSKNNRTKN